MCEPLGCMIVSHGDVRVVESFGKFKNVAPPGLNFVFPCLCQSAQRPLSMRLQQIEVHCETKTKDNVFVNIKVAVQFQINSDEASIYNAQYRLQNAPRQIESYVFDVVRSSVPKLDLDDVFTNKEEISNGIKHNLADAMSGFGYRIIASPVTDIDPNAEVKRAMNEINKAKRLRAAALDEGEALKIRSIKEAEASAARTEIQAKADAEAKFKQGEGIARQRQAIIAGLRDSVNAFKDEVSGVDAKNVMDLMLMTQYFDMMKDIGADSKSNAIFMTHSPAGLTNVSEALSSGILSNLGMKR